MPRYFIVRVKEDTDKFIANDIVAVGWSSVDFTQYQNPEDLKTAIYNNCYSKGISNRLLGRKLGEVNRFIGINEGDIILVPSYKSFFIGVAESNNFYDPKFKEHDLANQLHVKFKQDINGNPLRIARDDQNTALMTKLGVRGFTILEICENELKNIIDIIYNSNSYVSETAYAAEEEGKQLSEFQTTLKDILPNYKMQSMAAGGRGFEKLIEALFQKDGFITSILPKTTGGDGIADADIVALKESNLGDEFSIAYYIQAKHHWGETDSNGINQIVAYKEQIERNELQSISFNGITKEINCQNIKYALISSGDFSDSQKSIAEDKGIILIDGSRLSEILFEKLDDLDTIRHQLGIIKKYEHIKKSVN